MKKTLVSALTTALVVGAASTTFAAANPFSDVPADSWAYNAVATLARDGVVNGFPNGTFQGQKNMTRYEMAQIVAKAMAYENMTKADKALVDKLAVEFAQELNNLGVKVADLESKVDNVKFNGKVEYTWSRAKVDGVKQDDENGLLFRLEPSAKINDNWTAKSRLTYKFKEVAADGDNDGKVDVDRIYVNGKLGKTEVNLGRHPLSLANDLVADTKFTGVSAVLPLDTTTVTVAAGRVQDKSEQAYAGFMKTYYKNLQNKVEDSSKPALQPVIDKLGEIAEKGLKGDNKDKTAEIYGVQLGKTFGAVNAYAGYATVRGLTKVNENKDGQNNIWSVGANGKVAKDLSLAVDFAKSNISFDKPLTSKQDKAYSAILTYKGADAKDAGSYEVYTAYRNLGFNATLLGGLDDVIAHGEKGMEYGAKFVPAENILTSVKYGHGKNIETGAKVSKLWARAEFLF